MFAGRNRGKTAKRKGGLVDSKGKGGMIARRKKDRRTMRKGNGIARRKVDMIAERKWGT